MPISDDFVLRVRTQAFQMRGKPITFKKFSGGGQNLKTGDVEPNWTETAIPKALIGPLNKTDQGFTRVFRFLSSALDDRPGTKDVIDYQSRTYMVVDVITDQHDLVYQVVTKQA